jgi:hypothetical protein
MSLYSLILQVPDTYTTVHTITHLQILFVIGINLFSLVQGTQFHMDIHHKNSPKPGTSANNDVVAKPV